MKYGHKGNAKNTTLAGGVNATDLTMTGADLTGWPDGTTGPFWGALQRGLATEEKILFSSRTGNVLQVWTDVGTDGRGLDDTVAQEHPINSSLEHVWTGTEAEEASSHIEEGEGAHGYPPAASLVTLTGAQAITGAKTMTSPILTTPTITTPTATGGTHTAATKLSVTGAQAEAEFRVRNTYIGTGVPDNSLGSDGDIYLDKG